jgi:N-acetylglucosaminyldiphosphoundecaprenol N-acetyl-beta-D-mannosaminyltransferase
VVIRHRERAELACFAENGTGILPYAGPIVSDTWAAATLEQDAGSVPEFHVLGTPLLVTDYAGLGAKCQAWARQEGCAALAFTNTQIVTLRRRDAVFRELTSAFDRFVPDGMPLIWCLNRAGAGLRDRVYGPTFMRKFLATVPGEFTHYLIGGSEECGAKLRAAFARVNPAIRFIGAFHGKCLPDGRFESASEERVLEEINRLSPDFVWVGLGAPKQEAWVKHYKSRLRRGVILTVGFAFDVNAGMKPDAPAWMQRFGLTWIFRLWSEPRRLGPRYLQYNLLFLWYLLRDGVGGRAWGKSS